MLLVKRSNKPLVIDPIAQKLPELAADAVVLGFNYDTGERYLSVEGFLPALPG